MPRTMALVDVLAAKRHIYGMDELTPEEAAAYIGELQGGAGVSRNANRT